MINLKFTDLSECTWSCDALTLIDALPVHLLTFRRQPTNEVEQMKIQLILGKLECSGTGHGQKGMRLILIQLKFTIPKFLWEQVPMDCPEFRVLEDPPVKTGPMDNRVHKVHLVQKVLKVIQVDAFLF